MFPGTETGMGGGMVQTVKPSAPQRTLTHEEYCLAVRDIAVRRAVERDLITMDEARTLMAAKMVYGIGTGAYRGVCHYGAWDNEHAMIEIAATGEENPVQLAGTTVHETGHVLAGLGAGHGKAWKEACYRLGLLDAMAVGHVYTEDGFEPTMWASIAALGTPNDGKPSFGAGYTAPVAVRVGGKVGACPMGKGTRGGKYGKGSGSRLRLWECTGCPAPVKVRVASDDFQATCDRCGTHFTYRSK